MPRKNLTSRFVENAKVEARTDFWDDVVKGLVLRVSPTGVKAWSVVYTVDDTKRRLTIGSFPAVSLEKARRKALDAVGAIADGEDPAADKRARRAAMTVEDLAAVYIERYAKVSKRSWAEDERLLRVDVLPSIGSKKALAVTRRDVLDLVDLKADAGKMATARHVLAVTRKMFSWAVHEDYLEASPATGVKPRGKPASRDRVLSPDEIRTIWTALDTAALRPVTKDVLRVLLLTGQRSGEVCGITRSEVDLDGRTWTIPAERAKNGRVHVVPLSAAAVAIIGRRLNVADEARDSALFSHSGGEPIESNAIAKAALAKLQFFEVRWTPHDIRRTVATEMADLGVAPHEIEVVLNHVSGFRAGVAGVYNRNRYEREKRAALDAWAARLDEIVAGKKPADDGIVLQFKRRGQGNA